MSVSKSYTNHRTIVPSARPTKDRLSHVFKDLCQSNGVLVLLILREGPRHSLMVYQDQVLEIQQLLVVHLEMDWLQMTMRRHQSANHIKRYRVYGRAAMPAHEPTGNFFLARP